MRRYLIFWVAVCLLFSTVAVRAESLLLLQQFLDRADNLNFTFEQTTKDGNGVVLDEMAGSIAFVRPNKFRMTFTDPDAPVVVSDGKILWIYEKNIAQVIKTPLNDAAQTGLLAVFTKGIDGLKKDYVVTAGLAGALAWVNAEATDPANSVPKISLGFDRENKLLQQINITDSFGGMIEMRVTSLNFKAVDEGVFELQLPPETEVVEF